MKKTIVACARVAAPRGPLSQATRFGNLIFVSGRSGRHPVTGEMGKDIHEQVRYALEGIRLILEEAGSSLSEVLQTNCFLAGPEYVQGFNETYAEFFPNNRPARTTVSVTFNSPGMLVEINAIACVET